MNEQATPKKEQNQGSENGAISKKNSRRRRGRRHRDRSDKRHAGNPQREITQALNAEAEQDLPVDASEETTVPTEPAAPEEVVEIVGVRFRKNAKTYYFDPKGILYPLETMVVVETSRGLEMGTVSVANRPVGTSRIVLPLRAVVRKATADDHARYERNRKMEKEAAVIGAERIAKFGLDMKIVDVEYTFDNSKLLFYFTSEERVDFRELVKNLASIFKTRIELRQIGIRDEARMMGGIGSCGRPFCCSTFLNDFAQVSIKMAKEQNFSLNSAKISGTCGRLMCCLRYEHDVYEEALKVTPPTGSIVKTPVGEGVVVETRPLLGMVKVRFDEKGENPKYFTCNELTVIGKQPKRAPEKEAKAGETKTEREEKATASADTTPGAAE